MRQWSLAFESNQRICYEQASAVYILGGAHHEPCVLWWADKQGISTLLEL